MTLAALCLALSVQLPVPASNIVGYQVRVVEMRGYEWRARMHPQLKPIENQGGATVWTAPRSELSTIMGASDATIFEPKPASGLELRAAVRNSLRVPYVANLMRRADGPRGQATALAYEPEIAHVDETLNVSVACAAEPEGVRTAIALDETRIASLLTYTISEEVQPTDKTVLGAKPVKLDAQIQVPEVVHGRVAGEWVVPYGNILVVGLGPHHMKTPSGKVYLAERVAVIEPEQPTAIPTAQPAPIQDARAARVGHDLPALPDGQDPAPIAESGAWHRNSTNREASVPVVASRSMEPASIGRSMISTPHLADRSPQPARTGHEPILISTPANGPTVIVIPAEVPIRVNGMDGRAAQAALASWTAMVTPAESFAVPAHPSARMAAAPAPALSAMPTLPSRSLPTPLNARGEVVPLPPLPETSADVPDDSAEPRGTPQTPGVHPGEMPVGTDGSDHQVMPQREVSGLAGHFSIGLAVPSRTTRSSGWITCAAPSSDRSVQVSAPPQDGVDNDAWRAADPTVVPARAIDDDAAPSPSSSGAEANHGKRRLTLTLGMHATPTHATPGAAHLSWPIFPFRVGIVFDPGEAHAEK